MRKIFWMPILACLIAALAGCEKDEEHFPYESELSVSKHLFENFKRDCNNTYQYTVYEGWGFPGHEDSEFTTITVNRGQVVRRECEYSHNGETTMSWTEDKEQLGSNLGGAEPVTLNSIYAKAKEWLQVKGAIKYDFYAENDGMISLCGYVTEMIIGGSIYKESISISEITSGNP